METTDSYIVVEKMIRQREIALSELQELLPTLESQGQITAEECEALLELATESYFDNTSSPTMQGI